MSVQRIRTIKPEFFLHEDLAQLTMAARLLFIGLWTVADREGRLEDRPRRLKVQLFPYDDLDVDLLLKELAARKFIRRYRATDGLGCIDIPTFPRHQRPNVREAASLIPACTDAHVHARADTCVHEPRARAQGTGTGTGTGTEEKISLTAPRGASQRPWPEDFSLTLERAEVARTLGNDPATEWAKFKDHALKDGVRHKNWDAAWRYWCRRAPEFRRRA